MNFLTLVLLIVVLLNEIKEATLDKNRTYVESEKHLISKLFNNYDKKSRPSDTVQVKFSLYLNQIITIIEQEQILLINVFLDHEWLDERLKWNPSENNNINLLRISSDLLWT